VIGNASPVPEPSTLALALLAVLGVPMTQFARHHFRCQTVWSARPRPRRSALALLAQCSRLHSCHRSNLRRSARPTQVSRCNTLRSQVVWAVVSLPEHDRRYAAYGTDGTARSSHAHPIIHSSQPMANRKPAPVCRSPAQPRRPQRGPAASLRAGLCRRSSHLFHGDRCRIMLAYNSAPIATSTGPSTSAPSPSASPSLSEPNDQTDNNTNGDKRLHDAPLSEN
jgi:hypothetical protein